MKRMRLFADGGSRGNPGPAALGYVLFELSADGEMGERIFEEGIYIGEETNNIAEYSAIVAGLKKAKELGADEVDVRLDSQLAVRQINGQYKVKNPGIAKKYLEVHNLRQQFRKTVFTHVRREFNKEADAMVNKALDAHLEV